MNGPEVATLIAEMGKFSGMVKSEAETTTGVTVNGRQYVSIRQVTAEDLLNSIERWQKQLGGLLTTEPVELTVELEPAEDPS